MRYRAPIAHKLEVRIGLGRMSLIISCEMNVEIIIFASLTDVIIAHPSPIIRLVGAPRSIMVL